MFNNDDDDRYLVKLPEGFSKEVHPRTGHGGPEGEWRFLYCSLLFSTVSLTSSLDGGG